MLHFAMMKHGMFDKYCDLSCLPLSAMHLYHPVHAGGSGEGLQDAVRLGHRALRCSRVHLPHHEQPGRPDADGDGPGDVPGRA